MAEGVATNVWTYRAIFAGIAILSLFLRILPLSTLPSVWPGPDVLACLACAWVLRRPDFVPALLIVAVFFIEDIITLRPPGLWSLIMLLGTEFLRGREPFTRELPFPLEWAMVAGMFLIMMVANRMVLALVVSPQSDFGYSFLQSVLTISTYPVIVVLSQLLFGVRKSATGEVDSRGRRL